MEIKSIENIFNRKGDWIVKIDPYRIDIDNPIYQYLFDEDGYANDRVIQEAKAYADEIKAPWYSELVKYIYSENFDASCGGNYNAKFAWRH